MIPTPRMDWIALARKKSNMITQIDDRTTALMVDRPTPTVPPVVDRPLWQDMPPITIPKKKGLIIPPIRSLDVIPFLTEVMNTFWSWSNMYEAPDPPTMMPNMT